MDLSIVIVTHNSRSPVEKCLESIMEHPPSMDYEIVVVDNASVDGTPGFLSEKYPSVRLLANRDNRGYSRAVNQGFRASSGRYALVLNPDIIVRYDSIDALVRFMDSSRGAGIAGSKLVFPDGGIQPSCRSFYTLRAILLRRTFLGRLFPRARALRDHLMTDFDHSEARRVDWIIGACMIVRREAAESVGLMDERFFLYFEDTDWCYRMSQHGWEVWYVPQSVMVHLYERSSAGSMLSRPFLFHVLSLLRYYEKWNAVFFWLRRHRGSVKTLVFVLSDLIAINASFLCAYYLRVFLQPLFIRGLYPLDWYSIFIVFFNFLFLLTFTSMGLYRIRRGTELAEEFSGVIRSVLIIFAVLLTASYLTKVRIFSRAVILGHAFLSVVTVTASRRLIRRIHRGLVSASFDLRRILIAGDGEEAVRFSGMIEEHPEAGLDLIGRIGPGEDSLGSIDDLPSIVEKFKVQEIIVFPSAFGEESMVRMMTGPVSGSVRINIVSPAARLTGRDTRTEHIDGVYMFAVERGAAFLVSRIVQRMIDIAAGLVLFPVSLILWLPLRIFAALTGKVRFFSERRVGRGGEFSWPRAVLPSGRELSDIFKVLLPLNLIAGRISIIGPPPRHRGSGWDAPVARPGISGLWRIEPPRDMEKASEEEILMLNNISFTGRILLAVRSVVPCLAGRYPDWFHEKGEYT